MNSIEEQQKKARELFNALPMPQGDKRTSYHSVVFPEQLEHAQLTIHGDGEVLTEKTKNYAEKFAEYFKGEIEENKMIAFTLSYWKNIAIVHLPAHKDAGVVELLWNVQGNNATRTLIIAEEGSKATIVEKNTGNAVFRSELVELIVKQEAELTYLSIQDTANECVWLGNKRGYVEKNGLLSLSEGCFGGKFVVADTRVYLQGEGAKTMLNTGFFGTQEQHFDIINTCIHDASHTASVMNARGALDDYAKQVYRGLIHVNAKSSAVTGRQQEDTLMLSEHAETHPIPMLEVENNDVQCAHGAAVAHIDDERRFYLETRGVAKKEAEKLLIEAFFTPFLQKYNQKIGEECRALVGARI